LLPRLEVAVKNPTQESVELLEEASAELCSLPPDSASVARANCLLAIAEYYYLAARPSAALEPAKCAVECASQLGDLALERKALTFLGVMRVNTGNLPEATECYSRALEIARQLGDRPAEARVWNNLGFALQSAAQYPDAMSCFRRAISACEGAIDPGSIAQAAKTNLAACALHLGDIKTGLRAVQESLKTNPDPQSAQDRLLRVNAESIYSRLLLEIGEVDGAKLHSNSARNLANVSGAARAQLIAETTSGLVEIHSGMQDVGLTRLKKSLEIARKSVRSEVRDNLSACVAGYEAAGQPDVALIYLHELLALNRDAKAAQVLMHHKDYVARLEQPAFSPGSLELAMANHRGKLRIQLGERELMRNRILLLEQQSVAAELHDDTTGEHCYRVGRLASILGKEIGLEEDVCFLIDLAARLHDIGKLVVPDAILLKPGKLTPGEREIMETHTIAGADILAKSNVPQMHIAEEIARHHHERWDGSGYPMKLAGTAIPIAARVSALADVFDALTHKRPYKEAWKVSEALAEIRSLKGRQFDPELTDIFLDLVPRLQREYGDLDEFLAVEAKNSPFIKARKQIAEALKGHDPETSLFDMRR
jgi:putative two-component system response regulator